MKRMLPSGGLRAAGAALLTFAAILLGASTSGSAASYTIDYSGTVTTIGGIGGGVFKALGVAVGDAVSGTLTLDPIKTTPDNTSVAVNDFDQSSVSFTFHVTHPGKVDLNFSDAGSGTVTTVGSPNAASGIKFEADGGTSALELTYQTDPTGGPLTSLSGLPTTADALIALFAGASPSATGDFILKGYGQLVFDIALAAPVAGAPIPATLPLLFTSLGGLGFLAWRRRA